MTTTKNLAEHPEYKGLLADMETMLRAGEDITTHCLLMADWLDEHDWPEDNCYAYAWRWMASRKVAPDVDKKGTFFFKVGTWLFDEKPTSRIPWRLFEEMGPCKWSSRRDNRCTSKYLKNLVKKLGEAMAPLKRAVDLDPRTKE